MIGFEIKHFIIRFYKECVPPKLVRPSHLAAGRLVCYLYTGVCTEDRYVEDYVPIYPFGAVSVSFRSIHGRSLLLLASAHAH